MTNENQMGQAGKSDYVPSTQATEMIYTVGPDGLVRESIPIIKDTFDKRYTSR